ncbi:MAG: type II toxin-antitoxin system VapC family toxin [Candidatus Competibacter denitrificans]
MKTYLVDTNVLLDVIGADAHFGCLSRDCLIRCGNEGILVINPVIYAEVSAVVESLEELDTLLSGTLFRHDPLPWPAAFLAGRAFRQYRARGGSRTRVLADFLIGAHAATENMILITRDRGYATYFQVAIEDPTENKNGSEV